MRDHAIVSPHFWTGETGRFLRDYPDAQRLAFYLMTCPSSNMIGLYYLPMPTICHELRLSPEGASEGLRRAFEGGFATYAEAEEVVWVRKMAYFQVGKTLKPSDNKIKAIEKMLYCFRKSCFFNDFIQEYKAPFKLSEKRILRDEAPFKPLQRGSSQEKDQEQEINTVLPSEKNGDDTHIDKPLEKKFVRPSIEEVREFCAERKKGVNADAWFDHYTANGWKVGKNAMKDWRAAVRQWERHSFGNSDQEVTKTRPMTNEEMEAL